MVKNIIGQRFGRLMVVSFLEPAPKAHSTLWLCQCDCGNKAKIQSNNLRSGHTRSCGCLETESKLKRSLIHGHTINKTYSPTYAVWSSIKGRCLNPHNEHYKYYGGRGITICDEWMKFNNFLKDMGETREGYQIDRINNNLGYYKENCRWTTKIENMRNRSNTLIVEYNGEKIPLITLAENLKIPWHALRRRIKTWGMTVEEAIESCKNRRRVGINKRKKGHLNQLSLHCLEDAGCSA